MIFRKFAPRLTAIVLRTAVGVVAFLVLAVFLCQVKAFEAGVDERDARTRLEAAEARLEVVAERRRMADAWLASFSLTPDEAAAVKVVLLRDTDRALPLLAVVRLIEIESGGDPRAIGRVGEVGLMQVQPWIARPHLAKIGKRDLADPATNVTVGIMELRRLLREFNGSLALALAAYNGGPTKALRYAREVMFDE
jgi:hypothetical protein